MKLEEFLEQVQKRAHLASRSEAERATKAALETLAECLSKEERYDAASQLPTGLALYLERPFLGPGNQPAPSPERIFSLDAFYQRVSIREGVPLSAAREHAHTLLGTWNLFKTRGGEACQKDINSDQAERSMVAISQIRVR